MLRTVSRAEALLELMRGPSGNADGLFAVLDLARDPQIEPIAARFALRSQTLFDGDRALLHGHEGPLLAVVGDQLVHALSDRGWGRSWGIFLESASRFDDVREQLRRVLYVRTVENDEELLFRFYDPRVARVLFAQATPRQRATLFDEVTAYFMEDEDPSRLLHYANSGSRVELTRHVLPETEGTAR
jgi:hypothetical protein